MPALDNLRTYEDYSRFANKQALFRRSLSDALRKDYGKILTPIEAEIYHQAYTTSEAMPFLAFLTSCAAFVGLKFVPFYKRSSRGVRSALSLGTILVPLASSVMLTPTSRLQRVEEFMILKYYETLRKSLLTKGS
mmetsp:Transcript_29405/g.52631  ORF Transcript_29405/g.52631 Transcript_29405/m.52631 type:complete len:135 (-) Transcript_29405:2476-2880(-)